MLLFSNLIKVFLAFNADIIWFNPFNFFFFFFFAGHYFFVKTLPCEGCIWFWTNYWISDRKNGDMTISMLKTSMLMICRRQIMTHSIDWLYLISRILKVNCFEEKPQYASTIFSHWKWGKQVAVRLWLF